jgi:hypothetical protein
VTRACGAGGKPAMTAPSPAAAWLVSSVMWRTLAGRPHRPP